MKGESFIGLMKTFHTVMKNQGPAGSFCIINQMFDIFSKKYLTTNNPYRKRIQNNFKIRILYSPDLETGSGIPEPGEHFFS